jgi:O-antigen ligase
VAATNYFALFALAILLVGFWLLFRAKGWVKAAGAIAILAGAILLVTVLRDIKREIPSRRDSGQGSGAAMSEWVVDGARRESLWESRIHWKESLPW